MLLFASYLWYFYKCPDVFELLSLHSIKFSIDIATSVCFILPICELFFSLIQLVNSVQFLNITFLSLLSSYLAAASAPTPVIVMVPLTNMHALL